MLCLVSGLLTDIAMMCSQLAYTVNRIGKPEVRGSIPLCSTMKDQLTPINGVSFFFRLADFDQKSDQIYWVRTNYWLVECIQVVPCCSFNQEPDAQP